MVSDECTRVFNLTYYSLIPNESILLYPDKSGALTPFPASYTPPPPFPWNVLNSFLCFLPSLWRLPYVIYQNGCIFIRLIQLILFNHLYLYSFHIGYNRNSVVLLELLIIWQWHFGSRFFGATALLRRLNFLGMEKYDDIARPRTGITIIYHVQSCSEIFRTTLGTDFSMWLYLNLAHPSRVRIACQSKTQSKKIYPLNSF